MSINGYLLDIDERPVTLGDIAYYPISQTFKVWGWKQGTKFESNISPFRARAVLRQLVRSHGPNRHRGRLRPECTERLNASDYLGPSAGNRYLELKWFDIA